MGRIGLAFRAFFAVLFNGETAARVRPALAADVSEPETATPVREPGSPRNTCSEALLLVAALQREARFVDFVNEPIDGYTDEQVGAAVREIHRESKKVLDRVFAIERVVADDEGASVEVPAGYDAARYRLTGRVEGEAPHTGRLVHHGWAATDCALPVFAGSDEAAMVITPAEVEIA